MSLSKHMSPSTEWKGSTPEKRRETAAYIGALVAELRQLARRNDLPTLAYLLDIARLEAEAESKEETDADEASAPVLERP